MQEKFEEYVFKKLIIKDLNNAELNELCDYLLKLFEKDKKIYQFLDSFIKMQAVTCEAGVMYIIRHSIDNFDNFLYLAAFILSIYIVILNDIYKSIQNELKLIKAIIKQINDKNLIFLNKFICNITNDGTNKIGLDYDLINEIQRSFNHICIFSSDNSGLDNNMKVKTK